MLRQPAGGTQAGLGRRTGVVRRLRQRGEILRDRLGTLRGLLRGIGDFGCRGTLLLHRGGDGGGDFAQIGDGPGDAADGTDGAFGLGLDGGDLATDFLGRLGGFGR